MGTHPIFESDFDCLTEMEEQEKSTLQKWLPSLKKPEYVGMPKTVWVDLGRISDDLYTCALCHHHSPTLKEAICHARSHPDRKTYACDECSATFNVKTNLDAHKLTHSVKFEHKLLRCPLCQSTFRRRTVFRRHILTRHHVDDDFRCRECADKFGTVARLELHKLAHLARFERRKRMQRNKEKKKFDRLLREKEETIRELPETPLPAPEAAPPQLTIQSPIKEVQQQQRPPPPTPVQSLQHPFFHYQPPPKPPKPKKVRKRTKLVVPGPLLGPINEADYHQTPFYHHGPESVTGPFICPYCQRSFKREKYLRFHLNAHAGYRPYMCNICGKSYGRVSILKKHRATVHNKMNMLKYTCAHCGKCFVRKDDYKRHQVTHTNHRPWSCPYCHLYFKTKQACAKHIKIHAKLDNYKSDNVIGPMTQLLNFNAHPYDYYNFDPLSFIPEQPSYGPPEPEPTSQQLRTSEQTISPTIVPLMSSNTPSMPQLPSIIPSEIPIIKEKKEKEKKKKEKTQSKVKARK